MNEYKALVSAGKIITTARLAIFAEEQISPAWEQLHRVAEYLKRQANDAYRVAIGQ